MDRAYS